MSLESPQNTLPVQNTREAVKAAFYALEQRQALFIFLIMPLAALGNAIPTLREFTQFIWGFDLWADAVHYGSAPSRAFHHLLVIAQLFVSGIMYMKVWQYYFVRKGSKGGLLYYTLRSVNYKEYTLDLSLTFWGGVLVFTAMRAPSIWLLAVCIFFILIVRRCTITLLRPHFGRELLRKGKAAIKPSPFINDAGPLPTEAGRALPYTQLLELMIQSITDMNHIGEYDTETPAKHILAGWWWSDRIYATLAGIGFVITLPLLLSARFDSLPYWLPFIVTLTFIFTIGVVFIRLASISLDWGTRHADEIIAAKSSSAEKKARQ
jgi:hypothetical protein